MENPYFLTSNSTLPMLSKHPPYFSRKPPYFTGSLPVSTCTTIFQIFFIMNTLLFYTGFLVYGCTMHSVFLYFYFYTPIVFFLVLNYPLLFLFSIIIFVISILPYLSSLQLQTEPAFSFYLTTQHFTRFSSITV